MAKNETPEQNFKKLFDLSNDELTTQGERDNAQRKWQAWLKRHGKKTIDISAILAQAERDEAIANPPPPPRPPPDRDPSLSTIRHQSRHADRRDHPPIPGHAAARPRHLRLGDRCHSRLYPFSASRRASS